jgi:hypothetical protein
MQHSEGLEMAASTSEHMKIKMVMEFLVVWTQQMM